MTRIGNYICNAVIVPITKNNPSTAKDNYRPICFSNVFSKIVEKVLYRLMQNWLLTTPNQFGLSPNTAPRCVYLFLKS